MTNMGGLAPKSGCIKHPYRRVRKVCRCPCPRATTSFSFPARHRSGDKSCFKQGCILGKLFHQMGFKNSKPTAMRETHSCTYACTRLPYQHHSSQSCDKVVHFEVRTPVGTKRLPLVSPRWTPIPVFHWFSINLYRILVQR